MSFKVQEYVESCISENTALRRKLQSKSEAVLILSKELDTCRTERDQFKLMAEQLQGQYSNLKRKAQDMGLGSASIFLNEGNCSSRPGVTVAQLLEETRTQNKALSIQVEDMKQRLQDAYGDMKVLRAGYSKHHAGNLISSMESQSFPDHHKEELVQQLETLNHKCSQLEGDLQVVLDEKEDLVRERDVYKCKVHRLNHELSSLMKGGKKTMDIDSLIMENRYLQERLQQSLEEHEATRHSLHRYKGALDQKCNPGSINLALSAATAGLVVTQKQVRELLDAAACSSIPNTPALMENLRNICQALFDALEDKSLRLVHQRKANRILGNRIVVLESLAESNGAAVFPSQTLLGGYSVSDVERDKELANDLNAVNAAKERRLQVACCSSEVKSSSTPDINNELEEDCKPLPPNVQALVLQALEELKLETANNSNNICVPGSTRSDGPAKKSDGNTTQSTALITCTNL